MVLSVIHFEWGPNAISAGAPPDRAAHVAVVVDVLRFTTAVEAAVANGMRVHPYRWKDASAGALAHRVGAQLADASDRQSLSPVRLARLEPGISIVLPSPNGSTCAAVASDAGALVVAACLRNAGAVADWINERSPEAVTVVGCGERWPDGTLRPALEDHLGAAAVIAGLDGSRTAEATAAAALWKGVEPHGPDLIRSSFSGQELIGWNLGADVAYASAINVSRVVPVMVDGAFVHLGAGPRVGMR